MQEKRETVEHNFHCPVCRLRIFPYDPNRYASCGILYHLTCFRKMMAKLDDMLRRQPHMVQ